MSNAQLKQLDSLYHQCKRKLAYNSFEKAERMAIKRTKVAGHLIHAYWCKYCEQYHIGRANLC